MSAHSPGWREAAVRNSVHFRAFGLRWAHVYVLGISWLWCFFSVYGLGKHAWMGTPFFVNMVNLSFFLGILAVQGAEDGPPKKIPILLLSCLCMTTSLQSCHKLSRAMLMPDAQHIIRAAIPCLTCLEFVSVLYVWHIRPLGIWSLLRAAAILAALIPLLGCVGLRILVGEEALYPPGDIPLLSSVCAWSGMGLQSCFFSYSFRRRLLEAWTVVPLCAGGLSVLEQGIALEQGVVQGVPVRGGGREGRRGGDTRGGSTRSRSRGFREAPRKPPSAAVWKLRARSRMMAAMAAGIVALVSAAWTMTATAAMWSILLVMLSSEAATRVVEGNAEQPPAADQPPAATSPEAPPASSARGVARAAGAMAPAGGATIPASAPERGGNERSPPVAPVRALSRQSSRESNGPPPSDESDGDAEQETRSESSCTLSMVSTTHAGDAPPPTLGVWVPAVVGSIVGLAPAVGPAVAPQGGEPRPPGG